MSKVNDLFIVGSIIFNNLVDIPSIPLLYLEDRLLTALVIVSFSIVLKVNIVSQFIFI